METLAEVNPTKTVREQDTTRMQIRGSSLFLAGRFLSLGINLAAQVLMVGYLSTANYGALAYGLAIVAFLQLFAGLGLQEAISRFVPIYQEKREYAKLFGTILLALGAIGLIGAFIITTAWGAPSLLAHFLTHDPLALTLLRILIVLVPVDATDELLNGLFASFASTRDIFFRKYVLGPGLKLGAVLLLIWMHSTVTFLAYGYLAASVVGIAIYSLMFLQLLYSQQLLQEFRPRAITIPAREILAFVLPGLSAILATAALPSVNVFLLGYMRTMSEVAYFRAVVPVALLNNVVMTSFTLLYTPSAARLFAKADYSGINKLYWQTAAWMSVMSFPLFAMTFSFARPLTVFIYGARYQQSAPILALLALGSYFNVALGFNLQTLKVLERLRYITVVSVLAVIGNVAVNLLLIPHYGALGAAIGTAVTIISYNLLMQGGLLLTPNINAFDRRYFSVYLAIVVSALGLLVIQVYSPLSFYLALPMVGCASLFVLAVTKKKLSIRETFPELLGLPLMQMILTQPTGQPVRRQHDTRPASGSESRASSLRPSSEMAEGR